MFLLDTNAFSLYLLGEPNTLRRVAENAKTVWLSSVTAEEVLVGRIDGINRARHPRTSLSLPRAHQDFAQALADSQIFPLLVYSEAAEQIYRSFSPATLRTGPQDCRLSAQALAHGFTIVTRNLRDFETIGAPCVDWSV